MVVHLLLDQSWNLFAFRESDSVTKIVLSYLSIISLCQIIHNNKVLIIDLGYDVMFKQVVAQLVQYKIEILQTWKKKFSVWTNFTLAECMEVNISYWTGSDFDFSCLLVSFLAARLLKQSMAYLVCHVYGCMYVDQNKGTPPEMAYPLGIPWFQV